MSQLEYLGITAVLAGWCGNEPHKPPHIYVPTDPDLPSDNPVRPRSLVRRHINNLYQLSLAGLILITAATHPEEAFSLRYGPFMLVPAFKVLVGLYYNNVGAREESKVKRK